MTGGEPSILINVAIGCVLVVLVRIWVLESNEASAGKRKAETALTLIALILVGVTTYERKLNMLTASAVGLGVGFSVKALIVIAGSRITAASKAFFDALAGRSGK